MEAPQKPVGALMAGLRIIRYIAAERAPMGVTQIARDLKLNPSTCFNLLRTLVHERLVVFDPSTRKYSVGLGLIEIARGHLEHASHLQIIRPHLQTLATKHSVTVTLWQRTEEERVVLVERAESGAAIRIHMEIGQRLPLMLAALGRCMAAHSNLSPRELAKTFAKLRWDNPPSFATYLEQVEAARRNGYAVDPGNFVRGVTTVSSAVLGPEGHPVNAISAVGFSDQFTSASLQELAEDVRTVAQEVTRAIAPGLASRVEERLPPIVRTKAAKRRSA